MKIAEKIAKYERNLTHLAESVVYIALLLFFTYTFVAVECLKDVKGIYNVYVNNQATILALLTNFGLYFMLLIDYQSGRNKVPAWVMWSMALIIIVDLLIYGDAKVLANAKDYMEYKTLLAYPNVFMYLHLATFPILIFMKYKSLEEITVSEKLY